MLKKNQKKCLFFPSQVFLTFPLDYPHEAQFSYIAFSVFFIFDPFWSRGSRPGPVVMLKVVVVKISAGVAQGSELLKGGFALAGFGGFVKIDVSAFDLGVRIVLFAFQPFFGHSGHRQRKGDYFVLEAPDTILVAFDREGFCTWYCLFLYDQTNRRVTIDAENEVLKNYECPFVIYVSPANA